MGTVKTTIKRRVVCSTMTTFASARGSSSARSIMRLSPPGSCPKTQLNRFARVWRAVTAAMRIARAMDRTDAPSTPGVWPVKFSRVSLVKWRPMPYPATLRPSSRQPLGHWRAGQRVKRRQAATRIPPSMKGMGRPAAWRTNPTAIAGNNRRKRRPFAKTEVMGSSFPSRPVPLPATNSE